MGYNRRMAQHPHIDEDETSARFRCLRDFSHVALAVSGGADSMALMFWVAHWRRAATDAGRAPRVSVLTVDHGLRDGARDDATFVCEVARRLGLPCHHLRWHGQKPRTGVQAAARSARYRLLLQCCREIGAEALLTAHHGDDQAETLLMTLARGSGIDGLSGIATRRMCSDVVVLRPLLDLSRQTLREILAVFGGGFREDPGNGNMDFERVRVRGLLAREAEALPIAALVRAAERLQRARRALEAVAGRFLAEHVSGHKAGFASIDGTVLREAPEEIQLRVLRCVVDVIGGAARSPGLAACERLLADWPFSARSLGGCVLRLRRSGELEISREVGPRRGPAAVALVPGQRFVWDKRFQVAVAATAPTGLGLRPLGKGGVSQLRQLCREGHQVTSPRLPLSVASFPAIWRGQELLGVPHMAFWRAPLGEDVVELRFVPKAFAVC